MKHFFTLCLQRLLFLIQSIFFLILFLCAAAPFLYLPDGGGNSMSYNACRSSKEISAIRMGPGVIRCFADNLLILLW